MPEKYNGYDAVKLTTGPNGVKVVTGAAWIKITADNMADYPF